MENNNCTTGHQYGLWQLENEIEVSRTCLNCNHKQQYPMTSETLTQIKNQQLATNLLKNFLKASANDINIIGYTYLILEDTIDYIDQQNKTILTNKLSEIILSSSITEENKFLLENFKNSIQNNDIDLFTDTMDYFKKYNKNILENGPLKEQQNLSK